MWLTRFPFFLLRAGDAGHVPLELRDEHDLTDGRSRLHSRVRIRRV